MIVIHTSLRLDPAHRTEAERLIEDLVETSQAEAGTVRYRATEDVTEPNVIRFFEQYETETAAKRHTESGAYRAFTEALPRITVGEIETLRFEADEIEIQEFSPEQVTDQSDS